MLVLEKKGYLDFHDPLNISHITFITNIHISTNWFLFDGEHYIGCSLVNPFVQTIPFILMLSSILLLNSGRIKGKQATEHWTILK